MIKRLAKPRFALDMLWLVLLGVFVFAIPPTFHGDESQFVYMSKDYATVFIDHNPGALISSPPYDIDSDAQLRLLNGSINRYAIGLVWQLAGLKASDLPPRPGWDWGLDYTTGVATGHLPSADMLAVARFPSTLFLALSVAVMFALGGLFGRRPLAYFVSALYVLNPIILLNGRRAVQEGSLLFFGLLVIWIAVLISKRRSEDKPVPIYQWLALILAAALALASKQSGVVYVAGAFGWVFVTELLRSRWRDLLLTTIKLVVSGVLALALFVGLSPALWNNPVARFGDLLSVRAQLLDIQVAIAQGATTLPQRVEGIVVQPFMSPPQFFELPSWGTFKAVTDDIARYRGSPFSGLQFGLIFGGVLTILEGVGIFFSLRRDWRAGVLVWLLVNVATLLANPLNWQRYYLPLIPVSTLLVGIALYGLARRFVWKPEQQASLSHVVS